MSIAIFLIGHNMKFNEAFYSHSFESDMKGKYLELIRNNIQHHEVAPVGWLLNAHTPSLNTKEMTNLCNIIDGSRTKRFQSSAGT